MLLLSQHGQRFFFQRTHLQRFFGRLVAITTKMEYPVDKDSLQLCEERQVAFCGIVCYPFGANVKIAAHDGRIGIRKGDNIREGIMVEVFHIELVEVFVTTKDVL